MEKINIDIDSLVKLAIFLEGYKQGKGNLLPLETDVLEQLGNLLPLGTDVLEQLWHTINFLKGDVRYKINKELFKEYVVKK